MWKIGRFFGIDVSLHWTLLIFVSYFAISAPFGSPFFSATLMCAVFGCVLLHEFGHSLTARQFGIETSSIVLLPIGGVASLNSIPRDPTKEFWIAIAGPLVNVVIAAGLYVTQPLFYTLPSLAQWMESLLVINIGLVLFNLLPAFPMDGGRVLRALSALFLPYAQATNLAATIGIFMAIIFGIVGLFTGKWMLIFVAAAVYFMGRAEASAVNADPANYAWPIRHANRNNHPASSLQDSVFRVRRNGKLVMVVWDDSEQVYRFTQ